MKHQPVLLNEAVGGLAIKPDGIYVDLTYGRGGHSRLILEKMSADGRLIVMDKDLDAIRHAHDHARTDSRMTVFHAEFYEVMQRLESLEIGSVHGILMDLGVSSPQLDSPERGFSFQRSGPLDMRMNRQSGNTAADWLAKVNEAELADVIWRLGEERYARRIARAVIAYRADQSIEDTVVLADIIRRAIPHKTPGKDAATRTFQAIRIHVNQELESLKNTLAQAMGLLKAHGRLAVISFHSLEDRIVKSFFRDAMKGPDLPPEIPVSDNQFSAQLRYISKAIRPSLEELQANPRSRSAVLRVVEKL